MIPSRSGQILNFAMIEEQVGKYTFSSNFCSGNLESVTATNDENTFDCLTRVDCEGTEHATNHRTWFYFMVKGGIAGETITIVR